VTTTPYRTSETHWLSQLYFKVVLYLNYTFSKSIPIYSFSLVFFSLSLFPSSTYHPTIRSVAKRKKRKRKEERERERERETVVESLSLKKHDLRLMYYVLRKISGYLKKDHFEFRTFRKINEKLNWNTHDKGNI
jgi:hypothetical protein